jgi:spermidine synthase
MLDAVGGEGTLLLAAAFGAFAAALVGQRWLRVGGVALTLAFLSLAIWLPSWATMRLSPYKSLSHVLLTPDAEQRFSEWNHQARVDVVDSESIHQMPGLSLSSGITSPPVQIALTLDGDNLTPITLLSPDDPLARTLAANVPQHAAYLLNPQADVLIVSPRGGWDVLMALSSGAERVVAVEDNALVLEVVGDYSGGLYDDPRVQTVHEDGRAFVHRSREEFDIVVLALTDSFHSVTSGAFSLSEDYRYTVEAMEDYIARLRPDGILVIMRWLQTPPTESIRVMGAVVEALQRQGIDSPAGHIAAYRDIRTMTLLVSPSPFQADARQTIRDFTDSRGYDLVWLPDIRSDEVNQHNILPSPDYYEACRALLTDPESFLRDYDYDIRPATDDHPFFFHFFRWRQTSELLAALGHTWQPFGGSGYLVLVALLALVTLAAAVLILAPVAVVRIGRVHWGALIYFFALGLGFLFVEMPLAQQFIVFLGQPVTALASVLFAVLLASGLGSLSAPRWSLPVALGLLVIAIAVYPSLLRGLFNLALGWPLAGRLVVAVISLLPLGVLMGVPFARGLALFEERVPGITPWAWAVNGSASVISSVLAVMIAMSSGLSIVLWLGAGVYAVAWLAAVWFISR